MGQEKKDTKVLVFGSLNIDYVYQLEHFVQAGETISSKSMQTFCGGKGLNQSIAFGKSGVDIWHAGAVGKSDSQMLLDGLSEAGVHTEFIRKKDCASGHAIIQNTLDGENCIMLYGGANQEITTEEVDETLQYFREGDYLVLQNEISQMPYIMEQAHSRGMRIVLNPSPMDEKIFRFPLAYADYLMLNEIEGLALCENRDGQKRDALLDEPGEMLTLLLKQFPKSRIVLTLGKKGALYGFGEERYEQPIFKVKAVDTTAAGDTYTGFFISSLIRGCSVPEALRTAARASAIAVSRNGAGVSIPTREEVERAQG